MKFKSVFTSIVFIFLGLASLELGLYARDNLKNFQVAKQSSEQIRILVISDSVFGDANQDESLYNQLLVSLKKKSKKEFVFYNSSQPANSSALAYRKINEVLQTFKPDLSLILLGNSDYVVFKQSGLDPISSQLFYLNSILFKSKVYHFLVYSKNRMKQILGINFQKPDQEKYRQVRTDDLLSEAKRSELLNKYKSLEINCLELSLLATVVQPEQKNVIEQAQKCSNEVLDRETQAQVFSNLGQAFHKIKKMPEAQTHFEKALALSPDHLNAINSYAWFHYQNKDCGNTIKYFQRSFLHRAPERRPLMVLKECFVQEKLYQQGQDFFNKLVGLYSESKQILGLVARSFDVYILDKDQRHLSEESYVRDRDYYITKLYFYKKANDKNSANLLFKQRDQFASLPDSEIDIESYEKLVKAILANHSKVFALQYPNQSNWQVQEAISFSPDGLQFVSLADMIESKIPEFNVVDLFQDDFMHLTDAGAKLVADGLSTEIIQKLNLEN